MAITKATSSTDVQAFIGSLTSSLVKGDVVEFALGGKVNESTDSILNGNTIKVSKTEVYVNSVPVMLSNKLVKAIALEGQYAVKVTIKSVSYEDNAWKVKLD